MILYLLVAVCGLVCCFGNVTDLCVLLTCIVALRCLRWFVCFYFGFVGVELVFCCLMLSV